MKALQHPFLIFLMIIFYCSCEKDSPQTISPIDGSWNLASQTDTIFTIPPKTMTVAKTDMLHGSIQFKTDGTVYRASSFTIGHYLLGPDIFFTVLPYIPDLKDTAQYTYQNNLLTIKRWDGSNYLLNVKVTSDSLALSEIPVAQSNYKRTFRYSR